MGKVRDGRQGEGGKRLLKGRELGCILYETHMYVYMYSHFYKEYDYWVLQTCKKFYLLVYLSEYEGIQEIKGRGERRWQKEIKMCNIYAITFNNEYNHYTMQTYNHPKKESV